MSYDDKKCKNCEYFRAVKEGRRTVYVCKRYRTQINSTGLCASFKSRKEDKKCVYQKQ